MLLRSSGLFGFLVLCVCVCVCIFFPAQELYYPLCPQFWNLKMMGFNVGLFLSLALRTLWVFQYGNTVWKHVFSLECLLFGVEPLEIESVGHSVVSNSLCPHRLQPTRLLCPWNSPGKNTGVGGCFLLQGIFPFYMFALLTEVSSTSSDNTSSGF